MFIYILPCYVLVAALGTFDLRCGMWDLQLQHANSFSFFFLFSIYLSAVQGLCCCTWAFSSFGEWVYALAVMCGLLFAVAALVGEHGLRACGPQVLPLMGSRAQALAVVHGLHCSMTPGISQTRNWTSVSCIAEQFLNHWTFRETHANPSLGSRFLSRDRTQAPCIGRAES